jgi:hypothetical protein
VIAFLIVLEIIILPVSIRRSGRAPEAARATRFTQAELQPSNGKGAPKLEPPSLLATSVGDDSNN